MFERQRKESAKVTDKEQLKMYTEKKISGKKGLSSLSNDSEWSNNIRTGMCLLD